MTEWFHTLDDDFWLRGDEVGKEEAAFIKKALHLRKGQRVLDAPCGAGRITVHLAVRGCRVTAIDIRQQFVKRARARFRKARLKGSFAVMDLRELPFNEEFHGIFNWQGSFGYFSDRENLDLLRRYARALRPGGRLLVDQVNRERILRNFRSVIESGNVVNRIRWDARHKRVNATWSVEGERRAGSKSSIRLYTPSEMSGLFDQVGLEVDAICGDISGKDYGRTTRRMITVGRKPR